MSKPVVTLFTSPSAVAFTLTLALVFVPACSQDVRPAAGRPAAAVRPVAAEQAMIDIEREITQGLAARGAWDKFERYQKYSIGRMDASAGDRRWSDKTGNCRLGWIDWMIRNQLKAAADAERFSRQLHQSLSGPDPALGRAVAMAAEKLDAGNVRPGAYKIDSQQQAIEAVKGCLSSAAAAWRKATGPIGDEQLGQLRKHLHAVSTAPIKRGGSSWPNRKLARKLCDIMELMDRGALAGAAAAVAPLADRRLAAHLSAVAAAGDVQLDGAAGKLLRLIETADGNILIGGPGANVYDLDKLAGVAVVIDTAGNDTYLEGTVTAARPVLLIVDLAGDDNYRGVKPGIQGGAVCGVSMLVDFSGNDVYEAQDVAQGACLVGAGILVDRAGADSYRGLRRAHGSAVGGIAMLIDRAGDDSYHAALYAQGFGGPLGFGLLHDLAGADHYYAGGLYRNGYSDTPGYAGWSQGMGAGPRGIANGGIGVMLDGGGDDIYECDYFSHGGGYWFAVGLARDFGGNDKRLGSTRLGYDGKPRGEKIFLRWGIGFGCHYGPGFVFDDAGDDFYGGNIVGLAFAWDVAVTALCDFDGNDRYTKIGSGQGVGREAGLAVMFARGGDDVYEGTGQAMAAPVVSYHPMPACGGNFSFLIDYAGDDTYGGGDKNNSYLERASVTGFLIDRAEAPRHQDKP